MSDPKNIKKYDDLALTDDCVEFSVKNYPGLSKRRKTKVKERDGYECQICEDDLYYSQRAIVHHIDGDKTNQYWDNLIVVCRSCHALIHSKKRVPEEVLAFRSLLKY